MAALLPVTGFPEAPEGRARIGTLLRGLHALLAATDLHLHLYLQSWKLMGNQGSRILDDHLSDWWPRVGCGIWPDREPPCAWNDARLSDASAAIFRGEEVPLVSHKVLRLASEERLLPGIAETISGYGAVVEVYSPAGLEEWTRTARDFYLPTVTEKRFRRESFYAPLLDRASLAAAHTAAMLNDFLAGAQLYLRESAEDKGLLLLWRSDSLPQIAGWLDPSLEARSAAMAEGGSAAVAP
jgi:hypothetical protein